MKTVHGYLAYLIKSKVADLFQPKKYSQLDETKMLAFKLQHCDVGKTKETEIDESLKRVIKVTVIFKILKVMWRHSFTTCIWQTERNT